MRISQGSIEEVREAANIVEVASEFTALRHQGTNLVGLCPYPDHSEKTPSFSVSPEKNFCYCFGCSRGGDAIKLVMELKSFSFVEAVSYLAERSGVELRFEGRSSEEEKAAEQRAARRRSAHKALAAATAYYHKYLLKSPGAEGARRYLKKRGLDVSTIVEFRLGYAPPRGREGFTRAAGKVGLGREALEVAGLVSPRGGERFVDRVMFPISDRRGRIVGFGARSLGDAKPKYLNSPETELFNKRSLLYGFPQVAEAIRKEKAALVVEGYTDVLMLYQSGIKNVVATLGTSMTEQHLKSLSGHADVIYLLFDPDEAGEKAVEKAAVTAAELKLDLRVLRLPEDPADWLLEHTSGEFLALLSGAVPVLEYGIRRIVERTWGADTTTRARALGEIRDVIRDLDDSVAYWEAVRLASNALGVDPQILEEQVRPNRVGSRSPTPAATDIEEEADPLLRAEHEVLALSLARPDLSAELLQRGITVPSLGGPLTLDVRDFTNESHARIFAVLKEHAGEDIGSITSDERIRPYLDLVSTLFAKGEKRSPSRSDVEEAWLHLGVLVRKRARKNASDEETWMRLYREIQLIEIALDHLRTAVWLDYRPPES